MKILAICQYYYPEPFRITDICEELVKRGHEVMVVTGEPNYPEGEIYKGYEKHNKSDEVINGVKVHRCPIVPRKTGAIYRMLNYFSFPLAAKRFVKSSRCASTDGSPFDVVFVNQLSPVMMAEPAILYKKKHNVPVLLYCLDLWPESLIAGGINRTSAIYRVFHMISGSIYKKMDRILVSSKLFTNYLVDDLNVDINVIGCLPQYAESLFQNNPVTEDSEICNLTFAGNVGEMQNVDTILKAAKRLKEEKVHFHIVGSGTELQRLKEYAKKEHLLNVTFYGRRSIEEMPHFYAKSDAMLITMKSDPVLSLTLPGKVQSYMAAGKPIIGAIDGETSNVIKEANCGLCGAAENVDEFINNIRYFIYCNDRLTMGKNSRKYYENNFEKNSFFIILESELKYLQRK